MSAPYRLSIVMIVKNEAHNLALSLPPAQALADEIIIVDSGSSDNSRSIAEQYGAKWYEHLHWQGFGRQRQIAQSYASGDWILALDADEVISAELAQAIQRVIASAPNQTVYGIRRLDYVFGGRIDSPHWRNKAHWRLYPNTFHYNQNLVHESLELGDAQTQILEGYLHHHTALTPQFWLQKRLDYALSWAKQRHNQGKTTTLLGVFARAFWAFIKQYLLDGRFLQGAYGWIYAALFSQYTFNKYALLYDLNRQSHTYQKDFQPHPITYTNLPPLPKKIPNPTRLSVVMIVQNEQKHLPACLHNLYDLADEIVLLDSGSSDQTRTIAQHFGAKWHEHHHWQGFGRQRQIAQSHATGDYILMLDADEQLDSTLKQAIRQVCAQPLERTHAYAVARVNIFCHHRIHPKGWYADKIARLYAKEHFHYSNLEVHESLNVNIKHTPTLSGHLLHYTNDNLHHFLEKNIRYSHDWAQEAHHIKQKQVSWLSTPWRATFAFLREYILRLALVGGAYGAILSIVAASYNFNKYIMLWHYNRRPNPPSPRKQP